MLLDRVAVSRLLRDLIRNLDYRCRVEPVYGLRHDKWFLVNGKCLCSEEPKCPVIWRGQYYRRKVGHPAKTWIVRQEGEHPPDSVRGENASGAVCSPMQLAIARRYVAGKPPHTIAGLVGALQEELGMSARLPPRPRMRKWLDNNKPARPQKPLPPRRINVDVSLAAWHARVPEGLADLVVPVAPPMDAKRVCIPLTCAGMRKVFSRFDGEEICLLVDRKMKVLRDDYGMASASVLLKDKLRNTTIGKTATGQRVQALALASHADICGLAALNDESTDNWVAFFRWLEEEWRIARPWDKRPLKKVVRLVSKDLAPDIEAAREVVFHESRPLDDWFHFIELPTHTAKLSEVTWAKGAFVKRDAGWLLACLRGFRFLPTVDIRSCIWSGFLNRLSAKKEHESRSSCEVRHTRKKTVRELRECWRIPSCSPDDEAELVFSAHWCGVFGLIPGTAQGSVPLEAKFSPWQRQVAIIGQTASVEDFLPVLPQLLDRWDEECEWASDAPLRLIPQIADPGLWHGKYLRAVQRCSALDLWDASQTYEVHATWP